MAFGLQQYLRDISKTCSSATNFSLLAYDCGPGILYSLFLVLPADIFIAILVCYGIFLAVSLSICVANLVMLEFLEQLESGNKTSVFSAFWEAIRRDSWKIIPVASIWAIVWFLLNIAKVLSKVKLGGGENVPTLEQAAETLGKPNLTFKTLWGLGLDLLEKLLRMVIFLSLPAIAWENQGPFASFRKAFFIVKKHPGEFFSTYTLTGLTAILMILPAAAIFFLEDSGMQFSYLFWTLFITYIGCVWTISLYLEQMSASLLYLWHLKWERQGSVGKLSDIDAPDLLDQVYELRRSRKTN